jgi:hypothetical protein
MRKRGVRRPELRWCRPKSSSRLPPFYPLDQQSPSQQKVNNAKLFAFFKQWFFFVEKEAADESAAVVGQGEDEKEQESTSAGDGAITTTEATAPVVEISEATPPVEEVSGEQQGPETTTTDHRKYFFEVQRLKFESDSDFIEESAEERERTVAADTSREAAEHAEETKTIEST